MRKKDLVYHLPFIRDQENSEMNRRRLAAASLSALCVITAFPILVGPSSVGAAEVSPSIEQLRNLAYQGISEQPIRLKDGECEGEPAVAGSAERPRVKLLEDTRVTADLNDDGRTDAAVLLAASAGGSGESIYLAVVLAGDDDDEPENVATELLGDRVKLRSMKTEDKRLVLDLVDAGPDDAACCPSLKVRRTYHLEKGALIENGREEQGRLSLADLSGTTWNLTHLCWQRPVPEGTHITIAFEDDQVSGNAGCNRYFAGTKGTGPYDFSIGPPGATRRACPEPAMALESQYLAALQKVSQFGFLSGALVLTYRAGDDLHPETLLFAADR
jgi:heat shock protein HslJ